MSFNDFWARQELATAFFEYDDGAITICLARDHTSPHDAYSRRMTAAEAQCLIDFIQDRCLSLRPDESVPLWLS